MNEKGAIRFHFRHRWVAVDSRPFTYSDISFGPELATYENKTHVLYRCETCAKHKTKELDGTWQIA